jgi:hypothetical protein
MKKKKIVHKKRSIRCCYVTVDFATAASEKEIENYMHYLHKKTNVIRTMTKTLDYYYINFCIIEQW